MGGPEGAPETGSGAALGGGTEGNVQTEAAPRRAAVSFSSIKRG